MAITGTTVDIYWESSTDNIAVVGYQVFVNGVFNKEVGNILSTTVTGLAPDTLYTFTVRAFDAAGNYSNFSNAEQATTTAGLSFFLDDYPEVLWAGGFVRKHINATKYCRIRRASDNAETDVLVKDEANEVMDESCTVSAGGTLADWLTSSAIYLTKIYDQIGSKDATVLGAGTAQPQIGSNGVLYKNNGVVYTDFDGAADCVLEYAGALGHTTGIAATASFHIIDRGIISDDSTNATVFAYGATVNGDGGKQVRVVSDTGGWGYRNNSGNALYDNAGQPEHTWGLFTLYRTETSTAQDNSYWLARFNAVAGTLSSSAATADYNFTDEGLKIGGGTTSGSVDDYEFDGLWQFSAVYDGNVTSDLSAIESNLMSSFGLVEDTTPPAQPTIAFVSATDTTMTYNFSGTDNNAIARWEVWTGGLSALIDTVDFTASPQSWTRTGLTAGTSYGIRIYSIDYNGNKSTVSNLDTHSTTGGEDTEAPVIGTLSLGTAGATTQALSWTAATDNVGVTQYVIYRSTNGTDYSQFGTDTASPYSATGLSEYTRYWWKITAKDAAGNESSDSNVVNGYTLDVTAPSTPPQPTLGTVTTTTISASVPESTDSGIGGVEYEWSIDGTPDGGWVADPTGRSKTFTGLSSGTSYAIRVRARDASGNTTALSTTLNASTTSAVIYPTGTPASPTPNEGTTTSGWTALLSAQAISINDSTQQNGTYYIRSVSTNGSAGSGHYIDLTVESSETYTITLYARRGSQGTRQRINIPSGFTTTPTSAVSTTSWVLKTFSGLVANSTTMRLQIEACGTLDGASGDAVEVDNIVITKTS